MTDGKESQYRSVSVLLMEILHHGVDTGQDLPLSHDEMEKRFRDVLDHYGGAIEHAAGGNFLAHFGLESSLENTPHRAVNAALAMRKNLEEYCLNCGGDRILCLRVGIGTGQIFVGRIATRPNEQVLSGEALDRASILEELAREGQILVCPVTRRSAGDHFNFKPAGHVSLPGNASLAVYELLSLQEKPYIRPPVAERRKSGSSRREISSPMVGREGEMSLLRECFVKVMEGRGTIVTVSGEAGIGKSRLMAEFKAADFLQDITLLEGRAVSMGRNLSFHPVIDLLKGWAGISEDDGEAESLAKLEAAVKAIHPEEAEEIIPFVGTLMGMKLSGEYAQRVKGIEGEGLEKLIYKNVRELLLKGSELRPLALYIEDLHWADTSSLEFIMSLFRLVRNNRLLFILVFRPGYQETTGKMLERLNEAYSSCHTEILLQQLNDHESLKLMDNLLSMKGFPQKLKDDILSRSDGNPFFIEEVVRSLIDRGAVEQKGDSFAVTGKIHDIIVPASISEVLLSRIEALDDETRDLVKVASVIGRSFFYRVIVRVAENISDMDGRLAGLSDMELIRDRVRLDELEYIFKHALAQEAAYNSISENRRKELHSRVARVIEEVFSERIHEFYGMLAWHYGKAEEMEKTEEYLLKAGKEASNTSASREAISYFTGALDLYVESSGSRQSKETITAIEKSLALAYYSGGYLKEAVPYFKKVLKYYGIYHYENNVIKILTFILNWILFNMRLSLPFFKRTRDPSFFDIEIYNFYYKYGECSGNIHPEEILFGAINIANLFFKYEPTKLKNGLLLELIVSFVLSWSGFSFTTAKKIIQASEKYINEEDAKVLLNYLEAIFFYDYLNGDWNRDFSFYLRDEIITYNIKEGRINEVAETILFVVPDYCVEKGQIKEAKNILQRYCNIGEEYNYKAAEIYSFIPRIFLLLKIRKLDEALDVALESIEIVTAEGMVGFRVKILSFIMFIYCLQGDYQQAEQYIDKANEIIHVNLIAPYHNSYYYAAGTLYWMSRYEESLDSDSLYGNRERNRKKSKTYYYLNSLLRYVKKVASNRTEAFRHMGTFHWLTAQAASRGLLYFRNIIPGVRARYHYRKALAWWKKSIDEGERLGARLELSRSYFEVGKRAVAVGTGRDMSLQQQHLREQIKKNIGLTPEECLAKAETMFRDMDLQWDLDQLRDLRKK